jgi:hypothetical protein
MTLQSRENKYVNLGLTPLQVNEIEKYLQISLRGEMSV